MITLLSDNIYSPLGKTSLENYSAVIQGRSGLKCCGRIFGVEYPVVASLIDGGDVDCDFANIGSSPLVQCCPSSNYTKFERLLILSIHDALLRCNIDATSEDTLFVISSTKGNISHLNDSNFLDCSIDASARKVARFFGNCVAPIVVSNACISGVNAQIVAQRLLEQGRYRHAVVAGCDEQSKFIISGFQSFKALSEEPCKPFDSNRTGLNLGEAAATMVYSAENTGGWHLMAGAIRNDANHISGPSRTGEGCFRALTAATKGYDTSKIAMINAHGTATLYNDEMESIAISRASLDTIPVNALKGYFGHTMGAAGILETIISTKALDSGTIIGTKGFETSGVSAPLILTAEHQTTHKTAFIKMLSGFGGCNAAIVMEKGEAL